jgi:molybdopterin synthase catalytic subunit
VHEVSAARVARLTRRPIDVEEVLRRVTRPDCGAVVLFAGTVRDHSQGRRVVAIEYSAYERMAEDRLARLVSEISATSPALSVDVVHRLGLLAVGEVSVVIVTASPHREAAYEANRLALERLKREVPIWKDERYGDGERAWREVEPLTRV